jgi:hypothetical protein
MEVSGQLRALDALPPGEEPWYPLDRRMGGPQSWSGRGVEEKNSQLLSGIESNHLIVQPVASSYTDWAISAPLYFRAQSQYKGIMMWQVEVKLH